MIVSQDIFGGLVLFAIVSAIWACINYSQAIKIGHIGCVFIALLLMRGTIATLNSIYKFLPLQMDALLYNNTACTIADLIHRNQFNAIYESVKSLTFIEPGYTLLLGIFYAFLGKNPLVGFILNTFFFSLTAYNIFRIGRICYDKKSAQLSALFYLILPYSTLHSTYLYRDPLVNYLLSEIFYCFLCIVSPEKHSFKTKLWLFFIFVYSGILRRENLVLLTFIAAFIMCRHIYKKKNILTPILSPIAGAIIISVGYYVVLNSENWFLHNFVDLVKIEALQDRMNHFENVQSAYLTDEKITSFFDIIKYAPIRAFYFLFTPFPWTIFKLSQYLSFFEAVLVGGIMLNLPGALRAIKKNQPDFFYAVLLFLLLGIIGSGIIQSNSAGAQRHRTEFTWLIVAVAFPYLYNKYLKRIRLLRKAPNITTSLYKTTPTLLFVVFSTTLYVMSCHGILPDRPIHSISINGHNGFFQRAARITAT